MSLSPSRSLLSSLLLALALASAGCAGPRGERKPDVPPPAAPVPAPKPAPAPEVDRASKPAPLARDNAFAAPVPAERKLSNGARLYVIEDHRLPLVSLVMLVRAGIDVEPAKQAGIAPLMTRALTEGTARLTAEQLAEKLEDLAVDLNAAASDSSMSVSFGALREVLPQALDLFAEVVQTPAFRKEDVERVRGLTLTDLEQKKANPAMLADDEFRLRLYGEAHPWGRPSGGTEKTVKALTPAQLKAFHAQWFVPNETLIVVAGDVAADEVQSMLEARLGGWKARPVKRPAVPQPPAQEQRSISFVAKPGASQSQVWVGGRLPLTIASPDADALRLGNYALGGLFTSRLNMNLREEHGYSYGVRTSLDLTRDSGELVARGGIIAQHTAPALVEYQKELTRFAGADMTEDELARSKEAYVRSLPSRLETNGGRASLYATAIHEGLPPDYFATLAARVNAVTLADVHAAAKKYVRPETWPVVIVGPPDAAESVKALNLGPVVGRKAVR